LERQKCMVLLNARRLIDFWWHGGNSDRFDEKHVRKNLSNTLKRKQAANGSHLKRVFESWVGLKPEKGLANLQMMVWRPARRSGVTHHCQYAASVSRRQTRSNRRQKDTTARDESKDVWRDRIFPGFLTHLNSSPMKLVDSRATFVVSNNRVLLFCVLFIYFHRKRFWKHVAWTQ